MKGLKLEPGWRHAWVTWLNLLREKSKPPASARIAPVRGSAEASAPSTSGSWVISQRPLSLRVMRTMAPARMRLLGGPFSPTMRSAKRRPSPLMRIVSP